MNKFVQAIKLINKSHFEKNLAKIIKDSTPISPENKVLDSYFSSFNFTINELIHWLDIINELTNMTSPIREIEVYLEILKKQVSWLPILKMLLISHIAINRIGKYFCDYFSNVVINHFQKLAQLPKELSLSMSY